MRRILTIGAVIALLMTQTVVAFADDGDGDFIDDSTDNCPSVERISPQVIALRNTQQPMLQEGIQLGYKVIIEPLCLPRFTVVCGHCFARGEKGAL